MALSDQALSRILASRRPVANDLYPWVQVRLASVQAFTLLVPMTSTNRCSNLPDER
jgi:hypothetical protein